LVLFPALLFLSLVGVPVRAATDPIEQVSTDERGVTLRVTVPGWSLDQGDSGRFELKAPGFQALDVLGRPRLPFASALLAVPPGSRAVARLIDSDPEEERAGVRIGIGERAVFRPDPAGLGLIPAREPVAPITDGPWPASVVEVGAPFTVRRQRIVAVSLRPFRYDEARARLWVRQRFTVRVDFVGGTPTRSPSSLVFDRHWEPVLRQGLLNYAQGRSWREPPRASTRRGALGPSLFEPRRPEGAGQARAAAFDEDFPEVRIRVDTSGVYQIRFGQLSQLSPPYPAGIRIERVSVHRHEFVEGVVPSYVTIELPIEVDDLNSNGIFDGNDRIVVYVQNWAERSGASLAQRAWGDAEVIYATAVAGNGLRLDQRPGWRDVPGLTPLASYPWTQHWERNFRYLNTPRDTLADQFHWTDIALYHGYYPPEDTIRFETNHIDPSHLVSFSVTWQGRRDLRHLEWAWIRNNGGPPISVADSVAWSGDGSETVTAVLPGTALGEGNVNTLLYSGRNGSSLPDPKDNASDIVGLNYFEATYWRSYRALASYLSCNSGDALGVFQVLATGFSAAGVRVYDVTDPLSPTRLTLDPSHIQPAGGGFTVEFQDSIAAEKNYLVTSSPKLLPAGSFSAVTRRRLAERGAGDYLLIVPEAFLSAVDPLVQLRHSEGLDVVVSPLESINDEFNGGRKSSYAIKRFVRHAFENWNAKFVLLLGDGSEDPLNRLQESSTDWIPTQKISGPVFANFGYEVVPCDPWYVCMNQCDLDNPQLEPVLQDLYLGRLPVQSLQQAQDVIAKLVAYESFAADQTWRRVLLLSSDDEYSTETFFGGVTPPGACVYPQRPGERVFRLINETVAHMVTETAGLKQTTIDAFNLSTYLYLLNEKWTLVNGDTCRPSNLETASHTHAVVTPELISHLSAGRLWWNYQGHANAYVLAHEDLYVNRSFEDDKGLLANDGKPFLFSAFSCHANAFARAGDLGALGASIGEELVTLPNRGSIASYASTGYEILPGSGDSHLNVAWADAMFNRPPQDEYLGDRGARVVLGETVALALLRYVPSVTLTNRNERGVGLTYHLLGDPATRLSIGAAQTTVTVNGEPVADNVPVRLRTTIPADTIEADLVSNVKITSLSLELSDPSGTRVIPPADYTLTPSFPDTSATGMGGRRYHLTYQTARNLYTYRYTLRTVDRYGVTSAFNILFEFRSQLMVGDRVLLEGDPVPFDTDPTLLVLSPSPLNPAADLTLALNGDPLPIDAVAARGDLSGREWFLKWQRAPYALGDYEVQLGVSGGTTTTHLFRIRGQVRFERPLAFPNPFSDPMGTAFSFLLEAGGPSDLQIRVYTASGRLLYQRIERGLTPGYHQIPWDGRDAEGHELANGVYLYRLLATNGSAKTEHQGRLVKLHRPRRDDTQTP
jgi:hypothetical protein